MGGSHLVMSFHSVETSYCNNSAVYNCNIL